MEWPEKQSCETKTPEIPKKSLFRSFLEMTGSYSVAKKLEQLKEHGLPATLTFYKGKSENNTRWTSGLFLRHMLTVAVDPWVIPLGTVLEIVTTKGDKMVVLAADVCAHAKSMKWKVIDIFIGKHEKIPREGVWKSLNITPIGFIPKEKMNDLKENPDTLEDTIDEFSPV